MDFATHFCTLADGFGKSQIGLAASAVPMRLALALVLASLVLAGCASNETPPPTPTVGSVACDPTEVEPAAAWKAELPQVKLTTTKGDITIEVDVERAPITGGNFLNLTRSGFYNGVTFHRVIKDFVIQGGDPESKVGGNAARIGGGGPGYDIPDEFNPTLRHDAKGILSMATAGPDTGGSQFFVTLAPTPNLDDRHSVFGKVVGGLEVVTDIGSVPTGANDKPVEDVRITKAEVIEPVAFEADHKVGVHSVLSEKKAAAGRAVKFAVVLQNNGNTRDSVGLRASVPEGWTCAVNERPVIPAGTGRVVFLSITPAEGASGSTEIPIEATSAWNGTLPASSSIKVTMANFGRDIGQGDKVTANYAGFLPDGRLFDASFASVGNDPAMPKFDTVGGWTAKSSYNTFGFTVGSGVIEGFTKLAKTAKEGETVTGHIPAADAYATGNMYQRPLTGRDLVFELEIVKLG